MFCWDDNEFWFAIRLIKKTHVVRTILDIYPYYFYLVNTSACEVGY
jgi:hypothetical protein